MSAARSLLGTLLAAAMATACAAPAAMGPREGELAGGAASSGGVGAASGSTAPSATTGLPGTTASPGTTAQPATTAPSAITARPAIPSAQGAVSRAADAAKARPAPPDGCALAPTATRHPLAVALARDLKAAFESYACVFPSPSDPAVLVPGFRIMAMSSATRLPAPTDLRAARWAVVERYAAELGLAGTARQELVGTPDDGAHHDLVQRVPGTWISTDGFVDARLGSVETNRITIDFSIVAHAEQLTRGPRVAAKAAEATALAAARADGAIPARLASKPSLALRTTKAGTKLVYEITIVGLAGMTDKPIWLVRVDASTGAVATLGHD
jgi:hypothetical protein